MQNVCIGSTCNCNIIRINVISRSTITRVPTGMWGINKLHMAIDVDYVLPSACRIVTTRVISTARNDVMLSEIEALKYPDMYLLKYYSIVKQL